MEWRNGVEHEGGQWEGSLSQVIVKKTYALISKPGANFHFS